ncbi:MAG TPA: hypothetical protein VKE22_18380 [Haliangiales bacterium]|nr:hypothetical protein [Haliangiales bacterium]
MQPEATPPPRHARTILLGGLLVGTLDFLDAMIFFSLRGAPPLSIFQAVAGGILGREAAFAGGWPTFVLGVAIHFFIATCVAAAYYGASRRIELLRRHAVPCGLAYGVGVYFFMQLVVIPLSALGGPPRWALPGLLNGIIGHALLVGLPAALISRRA